MPTTSNRALPLTRRGQIVVGVITAVALIGGLAAFAVAGGGEKSAAPTSSTSTAPASTTTALVTTTTEPPAGPVAPLTGLRVADPTVPGRPVVAVKVDNLDAPRESALPQSGLAQADVVYEEIVEGNITRLVGLFQSRIPGEVGPVRSARTTDVHLLPQLGRVLLAWSGGNGGVVAAVHSSPALIDVGFDAATPAYHRDRSRKAPHNLYVDPNVLLARAPADLAPPPSLFAYRSPGQAQPSTSEPAAGVDLTWGGGLASSPVAWRWDGGSKLYVRSQNGRPQSDADGTRYSAANVVVMVTPYGASAADSRSPEALTVGSGELFVYTQAGVIPGTWSRASEDQPAVLTDTDGQPILLTPGQTWVELPRAGGVTTLR